MNWFYSFMDKFGDFLKPKESVKEFSIKPEDQEEGIAIQKSFVSQFAENQNHHQRLFIQFLSSVLVVIIAYAYVYSNTASHSGMNINKVTSADSIPAHKVIMNVKPEKFDSVKYENGSIISYSQFSLLSIYVFAQIVLLVLSIMILHMGYSYRRDQSVVNKVRRINLGMPTYEKIYGKRNFSGTNKGFLEYLPNFNSILFFSICIIQIGLFFSLFIYFKNFDDAKDGLFLTIEKTYVIPYYEVSYKDLRTSLIFPFLVNLFIYTYYYNKYEFTVNEKDTYVPLIEKMAYKPFVFSFYFVIIVLCGSIMLYSFYKVGMYIHLWTFLYFYIIILLPVIFHSFIRKNPKADQHSQFILGLVYIICGTILFFQSYQYFKRHTSYDIKVKQLSIWLTMSSVAIFMISNWAGVWLSKVKEGLPHYLKAYNRFLFVLLYVFLIVYFLELKWFDYAVSCFFAVYAFLIGRRKIIKWRLGEYSKNKIS
ncbi:MAG: hypothetical protein ABIT05_09010 [Chitinophagaceae bacterium]